MIYALLAVIAVQAATIGWLSASRRSITKQLAHERSAIDVWIKLYDDAMLGWKRSFTEKLNLSRSFREGTGGDLAVLQQMLREQAAVVNAQPERR